MGKRLSGDAVYCMYVEGGQRLVRGQTRNGRGLMVEWRGCVLLYVRRQVGGKLVL